MTSPTGAGLVPGRPPCSPEWSTDPGATSTDPDDEIFNLVRDALILPLALDWDALPLCRLPPPRPDLLQGTRWGRGMVVLVRGPTGIRCAPVEQDKVGRRGDARADSPSSRRIPSSSLLPWATRVPAPTSLLLPTGHPRAGNRSAPSSGRTAVRHARHPTRPAGHRRVVARRRSGNRLGWPTTVHAEKGAMSHYASRPTPLGRPGGRWRDGRQR